MHYSISSCQKCTLKVESIYIKKNFKDTEAEPRASLFDVLPGHEL